MGRDGLTAMGLARAKPGREAELGRRLAGLVAPTRAEPGCLAYDLHRSQTDPAVWVLIEAWRSPADLAAHVESAHLQAFLAQADEVLDGAPMSHVLDPAEPSDL